MIFLVALLANFLADLSFFSFSWECDAFLFSGVFNTLLGVDTGMDEFTLLRCCRCFSSSSLSSSPWSSDLSLLFFEEDLSEGVDDFLLEDFLEDDLEEDLDFSDGACDEEDSESGTTWKLVFLLFKLLKFGAFVDGF